MPTLVHALYKAAVVASLLAGEAPSPCTPLDQAQVAHVWVARGQSEQGWFAWKQPTAQEWGIAITAELWPDLTGNAVYMISAKDRHKMPFLNKQTWKSPTKGCDLQSWN